MYANCPYYKNVRWIPCTVGMFVNLNVRSFNVYLYKSQCVSTFLRRVKSVVSKMGILKVLVKEVKGGVKIKF